MSERNDRDANPARLRAAALAYDPAADGAPKLIGKGGGLVAERIVEMAIERGIPVHADPGLLGFLMRVDLEERIPAELYVAVASVLAMVWTADHEAQRRRPSDST